MSVPESILIASQTQVVHQPPTEFQKCLDVGSGVQVGFNYWEIGVVVAGEPQLVVEMTLLTGKDGLYSVVSCPEGLCALEEVISPPGSSSYVCVADVHWVKHDGMGW